MIEGKKVLWIADDQSYGYGKLWMFDTKSWSEEDYKRFDEATDSEKANVAMEIEYEKEKWYANLGS